MDKPRLAVAALVAGAMASPAHASARCGLPGGADTVRSTTSVLVYVEPMPERGAEIKRWRSCDRHSGRRTTLLDNGSPADGLVITPSSFRIAGVYVAFVADTAEPHGTHVIRLHLANARLGTSRGPVEVATPSADQAGHVPFVVRNLIVTSRGGLAWRESGTRSTNASPQDAVRRKDRRGLRQLDIGPVGSIRQLRIKASTLSWDHDGHVRRASLI